MLPFLDLRTAVRAMGRRPGFFVAAMLTLALGLGGTTALFGLLHTQLFQPLPYSTSPRLIDLSVGRRGEAGGAPVGPFDLIQWRQGMPGMDRLAIFRAVRREVQLAEGGVYVPAAEVSSGFFEALGYGPVLGRFFQASEDGPGAPPRVVVGYRFWRERLGGDPHVAGRQLILRGRAHEIVGVAPEKVVFPDTWLERAPDVYALARGYGDSPELRQARYFKGLGLLRAGVSREQAQAQARVVQEGLARTYPDSHGNITMHVRDLRKAVTGDRSRHLGLLLGASALLLLLACLNVGGLFLARGLIQARDSGVRAVLGATWPRLFSPFLAEGMLVSAGGALGGLGVASLLLRFLPRLLEEAHSLPGAAEPDLGLVPALAGCGLAILACVACAAAPVLHLRLNDLASHLKEGGYGATRRDGRLRGALLAGEVALSVMLLVGSSLLLRSFGQVVSRGLGFRTQDVLLFSVNLPRFSEMGAFRAFHRSLADRLAAVPGVQSVGVADQGTVFRSKDGTRFRLGSEAPDQTAPAVPTLCAGPGYFATVGVPLRQGRDIAWTDGPGSPPVLLVNEAFAQRYFPGRDPIGQRIRTADLKEPAQVVGVLANARFGGPEADIDPLIVYALDQFSNGAFLVHLRSARGSRDLLPGIKEALGTVDPSPHPVELESLKELLSMALVQRRNTLLLLGGFTLLALMLASVGIYGMAAYAVTQRRREIAIRTVLGGGWMTILGRVLRQEMAFIATGLGVGLAGAMAGGNLLRAQLVDMAAQDPAALAFSVLLLALAALLACVLPALRMIRVPPAEALRAE